MKKLVVIAIVALTAAAGLTPSTADAQRQLVYSVKFLCGQQTAGPGQPPNEPPVKPGNYATAVNIHNFHQFDAQIRKKAVIALPQPGGGAISDFVGDTLHPNASLEVDCSNIVKLFPPVPPLPSFIKGFVEIISLPNPVGDVELSVVGVYTTQTCLDAPDSCSVFGELHLEVVPYRQPYVLT